MNWKALVFTLSEIAKQKGISNYKIAKETGYSSSTINRIFDLKFCPKLEIFLDIAQVLGVNLFIKSEDDECDLNKAFEKAMTELGRRPGKLPKN